MNIAIKLAAAILGTLLVQACSSNAKKEGAPAAPGYQVYRSGSFSLRPLKETILENGLKVIFIQDTSLPRVSLTLFVKAGVLQDPQGQEGLNAMTAYLLGQGTQTKSATQLADSFGQLGSEIGITPGDDFSVVFSDALSTSQDELLNLFSDVVTNPAFSDAELSRVRSRILAGLRKKVDDPSGYADDKMDEFLFGSHAYSFDINGTPETVRKISKQNVIRHYLNFFRPNNASLAVVGNFSADYESRVKDAFAKWTKRTISKQTQSAIPPIQGLQIQLVTKKNLQQTQIRMAQVGIQRSDIDFLKLRIANEILGGGFASRLNQKIRDDLALTYSISSGFDARLDGGSFEVNTFTKNETVEQSLSEILKVVNEFVKNGVTAKELEAAKALLIGQFPRAIETADKTAFNILALDFYGIEKSYLTDYNKTIQSITLKEVNEVIRRRISGDNFKILIYGDPKVGAQLKSYKIEKVIPL